MENSKQIIYGPIFPVDENAKQESDENSSLENQIVSEGEEKGVDFEAYGPSLPPQLQKTISQESTSLRPSLPTHLRKELGNAPHKDPDEESSEEEGIYGPMMPGSEFQSRSAISLEERALEMKLGLLNPQEKKTNREEWMIELPTVSATKLGLGPRQFKPNAGPDMSNRSSWTDTPNTKKKKKANNDDLKKKLESSELMRRDQEQDKMARKHKRDSNSLVELHKKKIKKDKVEGPKQRVPFNRETDLAVNKFDEAQKAAILKKAQLLDDRFSKGTSKYL